MAQEPLTFQKLLSVPLKEREQLLTKAINDRATKLIQQGKHHVQQQHQA